MKYWNKDKKVRQQHWHPITPSSWWDYAKTKRELQLMEGSGKFYLYYGSRTVWFERKEDAMWFMLRHG